MTREFLDAATFRQAFNHAVGRVNSSGYRRSTHHGREYTFYEPMHECPQLSFPYTERVYRLVEAIRQQIQNSPLKETELPMMVKEDHRQQVTEYALAPRTPGEKEIKFSAEQLELIGSEIFQNLILPALELTLHQCGFQITRSSRKFHLLNGNEKGITGIIQNVEVLTIQQHCL